MHLRQEKDKREKGKKVSPFPAPNPNPLEPVASVQLVHNQDAFVVLIGDLTVSMLVERGTIVVPFAASMPQNYGSPVLKG